MITNDLKSKIDSIWNDIYSHGLSNPLKVIEQITYLIFIKGLDDKDIDSERNELILGVEMKRMFPEDKQHCRWSNFKQMSPDKMHENMINEVFPFIRSMSEQGGYAKYLKDILYEFQKPVITDRVIKAIDRLPLKDKDLKGDIYEYCLSQLSTAGKLGQFRTPRHIIEMMVKLSKPKLGDIICDPACGTAGFLVGASDYIQANQADELIKSDSSREMYKNMFYGFDTDPSMLRIAAMNVMMHDISTDNIDYKDSLNSDNPDESKYTLILANPPFKGSLDKESISPSLKKICDTTKTELLFVSLFIRTLDVGGRCACIVPDGVMFGANKAYKDLRQEIIENHKLEAIISMPSGVFKPYAGVSTAIMLFTKTGIGGTDNVWFYDMKADGLSLDDHRRDVKENDIPDIIARYSDLASETGRTRYDQSFLVPKSEIVEKKYDLSINKYKEIKYDKIDYDHPMDSIRKIKQIEQDIFQGIIELEQMVKKGGV